MSNPEEGNGQPFSPPSQDIGTVDSGLNQSININRRGFLARVGAGIATVVGLGVLANKLEDRSTLIASKNTAPTPPARPTPTIDSAPRATPAVDSIEDIQARATATETPLPTGTPQATPSVESSVK